MRMKNSLRNYFKAIARRWFLLVLINCLVLTVGGIFSLYFVHSVYEATTTVIVGKRPDEQGQKGLEYNLVLANQQLAKTYETIAKSRTVLDRVGAKISGGLDFETLRKKVTVDVVKGTEVIGINVQDNDPERSAQIANILTAEFSQRVVEIEKVDSVVIVDLAVPPLNPIKPRKILYFIVFAGLGLFTSIAATFSLEFMDSSIRNPEEVEHLGVVVLGSIPHS